MKAERRKIGRPIETLPEPKRGGPRPSPFWAKVADAAKNSPGEWVPVTGIAAKALPSLSSGIHRHTPRCPRALADPGFDAVMRAGVLYVRWVVDA